MTFDWKTHPTQENAKPPLNSHHPTYTQSQRMHVHTSLPKGSAVSDLVFCFPNLSLCDYIAVYVLPITPIVF